MNGNPLGAEASARDRSENLKNICEVSVTHWIRSEIDISQAAAILRMNFASASL